MNGGKAVDPAQPQKTVQEINQEQLAVQAELNEKRIA